MEHLVNAMKNDSEIANIGRELAVALQDWAYTRKTEDTKRVKDLQILLVHTVKKETDNAE